MVLGRYYYLPDVVQALVTSRLQKLCHVTPWYRWVSGRNDVCLISCYLAIILLYVFSQILSYEVTRARTTSGRSG